MTTSGFLVSPNRLNALQPLGDDGETGPNPSRVLATIDSKMTVDQPVGFRSSRGRSEVLPVKAHIVKDTEDEVEASDSEDSEGVEVVDAVEDDANEADLGEVEAEHE
ncbi:hypothetical protein U1Q18_007628 [Sarracenia purpurea var. burkii]